MPTAALTPRSTPSLYSGMILALLALVLALQVSFLAGLAGGRGLAARPQAITGKASELASLRVTPCAIP